eukprot:scaffold51128_cov78-Cyclotella_meneghiniana.AAC.1
MSKTNALVPPPEIANTVAAAAAPRETSIAEALVITGEDRGNEVLALEDGGGDVPAADRVVARGVMNGGIVIRGGAGRGVAAAAGVGIVGEIVTGTGIAIIGVTAVNVTFVEIGMVLLVMEALLPISEVRSQ